LWCRLDGSDGRPRRGGARRWWWPRQTWQTDLAAFVAGGGVVIGFSTASALINGAGLLAVTGQTSITSGTVIVAASGDRVAEGLPANYAATNATYLYVTASTKVVKTCLTDGGVPVVLRLVAD
jgi:hypothetical protein